MKFIDLTGKKFEKLAVLEVARKNKNGGFAWKCKC